jgi:hypothetical protein
LTPRATLARRPRLSRTQRCYPYITFSLPGPFHVLVSGSGSGVLLLLLLLLFALFVLARQHLTHFFVFVFLVEMLPGYIINCN